MLMLLSVHVTNVLFFLVQFNNFALTMGVTHSYSSHPFLCALAIIIHVQYIDIHKVVYTELYFHNVYQCLYT